MKNLTKEELTLANNFLNVLLREVPFQRELNDEHILIKHESGYSSKILKANGTFKVLDDKGEFPENDFTNSLCRLRLEILRHAYPENFKDF